MVKKVPVCGDTFNVILHRLVSFVSCLVCVIFPRQFTYDRQNCSLCSPANNMAVTIHLGAPKEEWSGLGPLMLNMFLANVQSPDNKPDSLRGSLKFQRELLCVLLYRNIAHSQHGRSFSPPRWSDRIIRETRDKVGYAFSWTGFHRTVVWTVSIYWLSAYSFIWVFSVVFMAAVYIPVNGNTCSILSKL